MILGRRMKMEYEKPTILISQVILEQVISASVPLHPQSPTIEWDNATEEEWREDIYWE